MIGRAITALLTTNTAFNALVPASRVAPVRFEQGAAFPAVYYGTDGITRLNCRACLNMFSGTLEIGIMTNTYTEMENVEEELRAILDGFDGIAGGFSLAIEPGVNGPDDEFPELQSLYKRIDFPVNATKLS